MVTQVGRHLAIAVAAVSGIKLKEMTPRYDFIGIANKNLRVLCSTEKTKARVDKFVNNAVQKGSDLLENINEAMQSDAEEV